jgi:hypothetical protein
MTPKSAHRRRSRHPAGISAPPALITVPGPRALLATTGTGRLGPHRTTGALALAPVFPLALTEPSLATTPGTGTPPASRPAPDRSGLRLRNAAAGLCVLAAAAAAVSFTAQYRMVNATRHLPAIAALEAAIPDAAALVFACLGIALALHGRRALRARALNLASVGASVFMNAIAAAPGWRNLAIWSMPPVAYALASDTLTTSSAPGPSPDLAVDKPWSREEFREERRALGRLAATYLNAARAEAGWSPIPLESVWTWDEASYRGMPQPDPSPRRAAAAV